MLNQTEASFFSRMERVGSFGGKADQLNGYLVNAGNPTGSTRTCRDTGRLSPNDVQAAARRWLAPDRRVELTVIPAKDGGQ